MSFDVEAVADVVTSVVDNAVAEADEAVEGVDAEVVVADVPQVMQVPLVSQAGVGQR